MVIIIMMFQHFHNMDWSHANVSFQSGIVRFITNKGLEKIKMGGQGLCSVGAYQNKILIITSRAAKILTFLRIIKILF